MKRRLTLAIDAELLTSARSYAQVQGVPLSRLVEQSLRKMLETDTPTFTSKWRGYFKTEESEDDARYEALSRKYLR